MPLAVRPHPSMDLMFYLKAFTLDLALKIQMTGPQQFPNIYKAALQVEASLISI